jgi:hypothetical protein
MSIRSVVAQPDLDNEPGRKAEILRRREHDAAEEAVALEDRKRK